MRDSWRAFFGPAPPFASASCLCSPGSELRAAPE